ncbi:MAG: hypothetical protein PHO66_01320 [Eubacteriales bacterium]|nr:hypothetical protein [Eubacteriales bacterium]
MNRLFNRILAAALCLALLVTAPVLAEPVASAASGPLALDINAQVGPNATDIYANDYVPVTRVEGGKIWVDIKLPFVKNAGVTSAITVRPDTSDYATSPLLAGNVARVIANAAPAWMAEFTLEVKASAVNGRHPVSFVAEYLYNDGTETTLTAQTYTLFIQVKDGSPEPTATPEATAPPVTPTTPQSQPRVILSNYSVDVEKVYAGEQFTLSMELTNTSAKRNVQNIKLTVASADGTILPVGGSNVAYFSGIGKGKTVTASFVFRALPDAPAKPQTLSVSIAYEDSSATALSEEATISIPIYQQIRVKLDEPQVYAAMAGEPVMVTVPVYNMGKSTLYNVIATVEGEGLRAEQSYYAGNMESGSTKTIELNVLVDEALLGSATPEGGDTGEPGIMPIERDKLAAAAGVAVDGKYMGGDTLEFPGEIVLSFEDDNGDTYTERREFTASVMQQMETPYPEDPGVIEEPPAQPGTKIWAWVVGGVVAVAGVAGGIVLGVHRARQRKRLLEDDEAI